MAIDLVREIHEGDYTEQIGQSEGTRTFLVHGTDPLTEREDSILSAAGIPLPNDSHPASPFVLCRRRVANRMGQQMKGLWRVECFYSNAPLTKEQEDKILIQNPTLRPAVIDQGVTRDEVPALTDRNKQQYKNSAGDPFDPPPSKMRSRCNFSVKKNYAVAPSWYYDLADTINYHQVTIGHGHNRSFRRATLQFVPAGVSEQKGDNGIDYVEVRFTLDYKESYRILGFGEKVIATAFYSDERRTGTEEEPIWVPVPTEWNGERLDGFGFGGSIDFLSNTVRRRIGWDREIRDEGYYFKKEDGEDEDLLEDRDFFKDSNGDKAATPQYLDSEGHPTFHANYLQFGDYDWGDFRVLAGILS